MNNEASQSITKTTKTPLGFTIHRDTDHCGLERCNDIVVFAKETC